jgi:hypothetical protein
MSIELKGKQIFNKIQFDASIIITKGLKYNDSY